MGKSSVLRAGVAHHLRAMAKRNLETRGHPEFVVVVFGGWTQDPMAALLDASSRASCVDVFGPELAPSERAATPTDTLHDWTGRLDCDLLLVLDQTEEYFLYHEQEEGRGTLVGELPELVTRPGLRVSVLLAIRDDALARLDRFKGHIPNLFANYLRLDHLDKRAGRAAILGPIEQYNALAQPEPRAGSSPSSSRRCSTQTTTRTPRVSGSAAAGSFARAGHADPRRGAVSPARPPPPLGGGARGRLEPDAPRDARAARRCERGRAHAPRARARGVPDRGQGRRRGRLQPPGHAVGDEDRARAPRPRASTRMSRRTGSSRS